jgi:hypothetical protein
MSETGGLLREDKNPLILESTLGDDEESFPVIDPFMINRGEDATVPQLAIDATSDEELDTLWSYFAIALKFALTLGMAPTLWNLEKEESNKSVRARKRLTDLFSMVTIASRCVVSSRFNAKSYAQPNVAIAAHYWNVGVAMNFLSTPLLYYMVETLDAESAVTNQWAALTCTFSFFFSVNPRTNESHVLRMSRPTVVFESFRRNHKRLVFHK